ncbi:MAG: hypothetical protein HXK18_03275 [Alloprevotella tannerae]|nr:hypothetical protein [Alloprevotella tannerae]
MRTLRASNFFVWQEQTMVCRQQTMVWPEQTMVCRQQTIVWWEQTMSEGDESEKQRVFVC